jgi:hypothetical protein
MVYGVDDTYSPKETQRAYAVAARLTLVAPELENIDIDIEIEIDENDNERPVEPLVDNVTINETSRTIGLRQYQPAAGNDGHFVATDVDAASSDVTRFLLQALAGQSPQIGE